MEYPISDLLSFTKNSNASDLYLIAGFEPLIFLDGMLKRVHGPALTKDEMNEMIRDVLNDEQKADFEARCDLNFAIEVEGIARFRVGCLAASEGESTYRYAAFRLVA